MRVVGRDDCRADVIDGRLIVCCDCVADFTPASSILNKSEVLSTERLREKTVLKPSVLLLSSGSSPESTRCCRWSCNVSRSGRTEPTMTSDDRSEINHR